MATIIVDTTLDENDGSIADGDASLRDAIAFADSQAGADTITFASGAGAAFENGGTIRLDAALGELVIASDIAIDGDTDGDSASGDITIDAQGNSRVFNVTGGSSTIDGLVITGGSDDDGGGVSVADGAALAVTNSSISGNNGSQGGGIYNRGTLTLTDTTVSDNAALSNGGIENRGTATLTNSTVSSNRTTVQGGGIGNDGTLTLTGTTVSGNGSGRFSKSGGIVNGGTLTLTETTVSGNFGAESGGIYNRGTVTLTDSTVSDNSALSSHFLGWGGGNSQRRHRDADQHNGVGQFRLV